MAHAPAARPRIVGGEILISREAADTVNIVDPMPPTARKASS